MAQYLDLVDSLTDEERAYFRYGPLDYLSQSHREQRRRLLATVASVAAGAAEQTDVEQNLDLTFDDIPVPTSIRVPKVGRVSGFIMADVCRSIQSLSFVEKVQTEEACLESLRISMKRRSGACSEEVNHNDHSILNASSCFATTWRSNQTSQQTVQGYTDPAFSSQSSLLSCSLPSFQSSLTSFYSIPDDSAPASGLDHFPENFVSSASPKEEEPPPAKRRAEVSECAEHRAVKHVTNKKATRKKKTPGQRVESIRNKEEGISRDAGSVSTDGNAVTNRYMLRSRSKD